MAGLITINVHKAVVNGDPLADLADRVLANYQRVGKILQTDSNLERCGVRRSI
jgi:hypothetical protein